MLGRCGVGASADLRRQAFGARLGGRSCHTLLVYFMHDE